MELIILIGLQAAGKSTFYRDHFVETHQLVSKDLLRNSRSKALKQRQLIEEALGAGKSVAVDNTNPTKAERAELIGLGKGYGATIIGYFFEVSVKESLERNRGRGGEARVPEIGIFATLKRFQRPTLDEGFDQLYVLRPDDE